MVSLNIILLLSILELSIGRSVTVNAISVCFLFLSVTMTTTGDNILDTALSKV